jgi:hypothetical protein
MGSRERVDRRVCPKCGLVVTAIRRDGQVTLQYDIEDWARVCVASDRQSPAACPWMRPHLPA